jgi:hypothetical protein
MFKKAILVLVLLFAINKTQATVITVSNAPNSPAQYTDLQLAINAANNGDTIYVSGSLISYGNITVDKQLVLIGTGFNPQKDIPLVSQLNYINLVSGSAGSTIDGFKFLGSSPTNIPCNGVSAPYVLFSTACVDNITVRNNYILGQYIAVSGDNWLIEKNLIQYFYINYHVNVIVRNNLVITNTDIRFSNQPSVMFHNNLFIASSSSVFNTVTNAVINNNIFYGISPAGCNNCVFNNNLTFNTSQNILPYGTNTGSGNIENQDPQFINVPTYTINLLYNYRLLATSPCHNAGTDGTDIGPYGGATPFPSSPIGGEPKIPQVKNMNINNTSLPLNGNLNINVKGKKQD